MSPLNEEAWGDLWLSGVLGIQVLSPFPLCRPGL